ncbi:glycosyltransferase family 4 protein [Ectothiorhodospiraceae bacterium 2226]|nr:glycosyltransferase family 4 protein [Ectothiorhodospiraceae bacterium 2226]
MEAHASTGGEPPVEEGLRLLIVAADKYPPFRVDVTVLFGEELAGRGHTLDLVLQAKAPNARAYDTAWGGGEAWVGPSNGGTSRWARLVKNVRALVHDVSGLWRARRRRYDIVQVKDKFVSALVCLVFARATGARFTYWLSFPYPEASQYAARVGAARFPWFYRARGQVYRLLLYRIIMPAADHVFVQSEQMKRDVCAMGIDARKVTPVPMGVSLETLTVPAAIPEGGARRVVYLGTLARVRRLDFLVRAFRPVAERMPEADLCFVGDGNDPQDMAFLRAEVKRCGLSERVVFTGRLPRGDALAISASAAVCVSPFYPTPILNSTSPTKLIEYMAMGRAVVANDHPEQRAVLEASGGGICVPYEEEVFGEAIHYLLANPKLAREMGGRGKRYVERHRTYPRIADVVEAQYRRLAAGTRRRRAGGS